MTKENSNSNLESSNNNVPIVVAQTSASLISNAEGVIQNPISGENDAVNNATARENRRSPCPRISPALVQPPVIVSWSPFGLPPGYTPPTDNFAPPVQFENVTNAVNDHLSFSHSEMNREYHAGSTSNNSGSMAAFQQHIDETHHDLVNLLTQQMTTILNIIIANNKTKYERLARQVEQIAQIVDYNKVQPHNQNFGMNPKNLGLNQGKYMLIPMKMRLCLI
ncbi:hypothetical protein Ahy_B01g056563 [Arachis hypogaea]|uniref:Uncharacterized protein n=1 Tax=Arachis hypogaea TaxID=3818 RepID=A0A445AZ57_ARAHY|nr:hypothetical protein Ahy_B01g056563 [Arachis hypogaea]